VFFQLFQVKVVSYEIFLNVWILEDASGVCKVRENVFVVAQIRYYIVDDDRKLVGVSKQDFSETFVSTVPPSSAFFFNDSGKSRNKGQRTASRNVAVVTATEQSWIGANQFCN
jgi:hypothetical protein